MGGREDKWLRDGQRSVLTGKAPVRFGPLRLLLNQGFYLKVHVTASQGGGGRKVNTSQPTQSSTAAPAHAAMHAIQARALDLLEPFEDVWHVLAEAVVQHQANQNAQVSATNCNAGLTGRSCP